MGSMVAEVGAAEAVGPAVVGPVGPVGPVAVARVAGTWMAAWRAMEWTVTMTKGCSVVRWQLR